MDVWLLHLPSPHNSRHVPEMCRAFPPPALLAAADSSLSVTFHPSQLPAHLMLSKNLEVLSNPSQECMGRGSGCSWEHWALPASLPFS